MASNHSEEDLEPMDVDPVVTIVSVGGVPIKKIKSKTARMHTGTSGNAVRDRRLRWKLRIDRRIRKLERQIERLKKLYDEMQSEDDE